MTNPDYTHLALIVDRSGSMNSIYKDMEGGLERMFDEQAALPGTCLVDLAIFDDQYEVVYSDLPVAKAYAAIIPRGGTALLDAVGKTITTLGEKLAKLSEDKRPENVIVVIVTDGMENRSQEWTRDKVKAIIEEQQTKWSWKFVFLGANIDAYAVGHGMGMAKGMSLNYDASSAGVSGMSATTSSYVTAVRGGDKDAKLTDQK